MVLRRPIELLSLLLQIFPLAVTFKAPFWILGAAAPLQIALTSRIFGVGGFFYLGTPTYSVLSIFGVFRSNRFFWTIFFPGWKKYITFSKTPYPPELNYLENISTWNISKVRKFFRKRSKLRKVIPVKLYCFKYELPTPLETKVRANRAVHLNCVQGVVYGLLKSSNFPVLLYC